MMEKLLALAGGGSGGGGTSDFSTATVTFGSNPDEVEVMFPAVFDAGDQSCIMVVNDYFDEGETMTVPLYKGNLLLPAGSIPMEGVTLTGDVQDVGGGTILVTGDFSVSWG